MVFSEDSRVKIPCILHLVRLGYHYLSLKNASWDEETNIFPDLFRTAVARINPDVENDDITRLLADVKLLLDNEDLGKAFYEKLTERSSIRLIDFTDFSNNSFHVVTELTCKNGDDEFRPDITLLINGMPLVFIEVKKPNNREGVLAERNRIITRSRNSRFRRFINITQLMVFSNNMEYEDGSPQPIEGAFYASPSYDAPNFNYFREEETLNLADLLADEDDAIENEVLRDNNLNVIKHSPEFISNKSPDTPTNRICTSLFSRDRLSFLLQYALVYVNEADGLHKHVMRYPQLFATKAIERKLDAGVRKGIIWHTQGSGKTALAYYNTRFLTDYFQRRGIIPKFYFIVDRIDLLIQAQREFASRGLTVHTIDSRDAFARDIKATQALHNHSGKSEITVVNIQKFEDDPDVVRTEDYDVSIQRVYFLDEVHRSYNPKGSFLANLSQSDQNAIKIGLTGTPLLGDDYNSRALFGDYIHKYYYNASIADGYTLRLIREEIATNYKLSLQEALAEVELQQGDIDRKLIYAHPRFVEPMLDYIVRDFEKSRSALNDATIGGMVICDSSEQAKQMFEIFNTVYTQAVERWLDEAPRRIDDQAKVDALKQLFSQSRVALIYGAAGTGKSTMVDHIAHYFNDKEKLFLAHTNPAIDNLKRKVTAQNSEFRTISSQSGRRTSSQEYDLLVIDECSTVSNADLIKVLEKTSFKLLVLVGDVYQIESIQFGNWFGIIRSFIPSASVFELTTPFRTKNASLLNFWNKVRAIEDDLAEVMARNEYSTVLDKTLFETQGSDEIILCLNYDGLYGINNINRFLQGSNPGAATNWRMSTYKIGDPVLFNETERFRPVIYNNLKGKIVGIDHFPDRIQFDVALDRSLSEFDVVGDELEWMGESTVRFSVYEHEASDEDDDSLHTSVPFQVAYAVSIHKAQGLEYDSVKIVITDANEDNITHSIFYTAVTRARKNMRIFWTPETQQGVLHRLHRSENSKDVNLLASRSGLTPVSR